MCFVVLCMFCCFVIGCLGLVLVCVLGWYWCGVICVFSFWVWLCVLVGFGGVYVVGGFVVNRVFVFCCIGGFVCCGFRVCVLGGFGVGLKCGVLCLVWFGLLFCFLIFIVFVCITRCFDLGFVV